MSTCQISEYDDNLFVRVYFTIRLYGAELIEFAIKILTVNSNRPSQQGEVKMNSYRSEKRVTEIERERSPALFLSLDKKYYPINSSSSTATKNADGNLLFPTRAP